MKFTHLFTKPHLQLLLTLLALTTAALPQTPRSEIPNRTPLSNKTADYENVESPALTTEYPTENITVSGNSTENATLPDDKTEASDTNTVIYSSTVAVDDLPSPATEGMAMGVSGGDHEKGYEEGADMIKRGEDEDETENRDRRELLRRHRKSHKHRHRRCRKRDGQLKCFKPKRKAGSLKNKDLRTHHADKSLLRDKKEGKQEKLLGNEDEMMKFSKEGDLFKNVENVFPNPDSSLDFMIKENLIKENQKIKGSDLNRYKPKEKEENTNTDEMKHDLQGFENWVNEEFHKSKQELMSEPKIYEKSNLKNRVPTMKEISKENTRKSFSEILNTPPPVLYREKPFGFLHTSPQNIQRYNPFKVKGDSVKQDFSQKLHDRISTTWEYEHRIPDSEKQALPAIVMFKDLSQILNPYSVGKIIPPPEKSAEESEAVQMSDLLQDGKYKIPVPDNGKDSFLKQSEKEYTPAIIDEKDLFQYYLDDKNIDEKQIAEDNMIGREKMYKDIGNQMRSPSPSSYNYETSDYQSPTDIPDILTSIPILDGFTTVLQSNNESVRYFLRVERKEPNIMEHPNIKASIDRSPNKLNLLIKLPEKVLKELENSMISEMLLLNLTLEKSFDEGGEDTVVFEDTSNIKPSNTILAEKEVIYSETSTSNSVSNTEYSDLDDTTLSLDETLPSTLLGNAIEKINVVGFSFKVKSYVRNTINKRNDLNAEEKDQLYKSILQKISKLLSKNIELMSKHKE